MDSNRKRLTFWQSAGLVLLGLISTALLVYCSREMLIGRVTSAHTKMLLWIFTASGLYQLILMLLIVWLGSKYDCLRHLAELLCHIAAPTLLCLLLLIGDSGKLIGLTMLLFLPTVSLLRVVSLLTSDSSQKGALS